MKKEEIKLELEKCGLGSTGISCACAAFRTGTNRQCSYPTYSVIMIPHVYCTKTGLKWKFMTPRNKYGFHYPNVIVKENWKVGVKWNYSETF